jgi:hypothetical protein
VCLSAFGVSFCSAATETQNSNLTILGKGTVEFKFFGENTNIVTSHGVRAFEVAVQDRCWAIKAVAVPDNGHPNEMMCDGECTYETITHVTTSHNSPWFPSIAAQVKKGTVPFSSAGHSVACVWLCFASAGYLDNETNGAFSPEWFEVNRTDSALLGDRFQAEIERFEGQPRLPKSIECRANGFMWGTTGYDKQALRPPYNAGYPCFTFRVQSATNIAAMQIPTRATLDIFYPRPGGAQDTDVIPGIHVELAVRELGSTADRHKWQPKLGALTRLKDYRFIQATSGPKVLTYDIRGDRWPRESDRIVIKARQLGQGSESKPDENYMVRRVIMYALISIITIVFAAHAIRSRRPAH